MRSDYPPFHESLPTASLPTISFAALLRNEASALTSLLDASKDVGFFYLDLDGQDLVDESEQLLALSNQFMALPRPDKEAYGGKAIDPAWGYRYIEDEDDSSIRKWEGYMIRKDDLIHAQEIPYHPVITSRFDLLRSFTTHCRLVTDTILAALETQLGIPGELLKRHRLDRPSGDCIRFNRAPPASYDETKATKTEHSDFGTLTVLFNWLGGLQVRVDGTWKYIKPRRGTCIINLGDSLVKLTAGLLTSSVHRITPPQYAQSGRPRDSIVYLVRPENDVTLKSIDGLDGPLASTEEMSTADWIRRRTAGDLTGTINRDGTHESRTFVLK